MKEQNPFGFGSKTLINCRGNLVDLAQPKIMGILNLTPDSFSDGGNYDTPKKALFQIEKMLTEGATIIDLGAQSTKPNATLHSPKEEMERLGNIIGTIRTEFPNALISLDTFYTEVARFGADQGIDMINDISGGQFDEKMFETVAQLGLLYILMHCNSSHHKMHEKLKYEDISVSLNLYFSEKINQLHALGVKDILADPGFGFGKTLEDQHKLLDELQYLTFGQYPLLVGISRKSFIYKPLGKSPHNIEEEMHNLHIKALEKGAKILRVHNVAAAQKSIDVFRNQIK